MVGSSGCWSLCTSCTGSTRLSLLYQLSYCTNTQPIAVGSSIAVGISDRHRPIAVWAVVQVVVMVIMLVVMMLRTYYYNRNHCC